ncbi:uncharacterized protein RCC_06824 [Ramularia collo-cygni]|uniref:Uncharacterized protein n=1 Tax=Ramularia collo-cygni TaxID=112498 RepID=A0A2D3VJ85_9PEZI|nr:uncharacterized protein RCC_06824 [Ramularia collo-cygni]CZT20963.1 uncharacterized protein RCC_06824 [Ramularia collo-cygni]
MSRDSFSDGIFDRMHEGVRAADRSRAEWERQQMYEMEARERNHGREHLYGRERGHSGDMRGGEYYGSSGYSFEGAQNDSLRRHLLTRPRAEADFNHAVPPELLRRRDSISSGSAIGAGMGLTQLENEVYRRRSAYPRSRDSYRDYQDSRSQDNYGNTRHQHRGDTSRTSDSSRFVKIEIKVPVGGKGKKKERERARSPTRRGPAYEDLRMHHQPPYEDLRMHHQPPPP